MKILVIRLSSLGDVVLTTPVVRCLKEQVADAEVHFVTKPACAELLVGNSHIDKIIRLQEDIDATIEELRKERYDCVVDLHNNHRSRKLRRALRVRSLVYRKENFGKMVLVLFKKDLMTGRHVVERYLAAVRRLGVSDDGRGLELSVGGVMPEGVPEEGRYVVIACGAQHATKRIPPAKIAELIDRINLPVVLVGDKADRARLAAAGVALAAEGELVTASGMPVNAGAAGESVNAGAAAGMPVNAGAAADVSSSSGVSRQVVNMCGVTTLAQSARIVKGAAVVVTPDSAMMHIAAACGVRVVALWGATSARFGFYAFRTPHCDCVVGGLRCRPCRRMGSAKCPKGHFRCMYGQDTRRIGDYVNDVVENQNKEYYEEIVSMVGNNG